jgi:hypothetical protein
VSSIGPDSRTFLILFSAIAALLCFVVSLPRTLSQLSALGTFSAVTMGLAVLLAIIFAGIQSEPFGFVAGEPPIVTAFPVAGTTFVTGKLIFAFLFRSAQPTFAGMSAFLNISYTLIGQITIPSVRFCYYLCNFFITHSV